MTARLQSRGENRTAWAECTNKPSIVISTTDDLEVTASTQVITSPDIVIRGGTRFWSAGDVDEYYLIRVVAHVIQSMIRGDRWYQKYGDTSTGLGIAILTAAE